MSMIVFCGPTISPQEAQRILTADYRPPAKQGDIYLATLDQPDAIVLIDGYFESVPAVWHKEILYAMSIGIHVFGCSSMGALRAAELAHFGMEGFGAVFEYYQHGELEDDDEVALVHGPAALGYPPASEPMVNLRATIDAAVTAQVLDRQTATRLVSSLKQLWYPQRNYAALLSFAENGLDHEKFQTFKQYLSQHTVDIKKQDALQLLSQLAQRPDSEGFLSAKGTSANQAPGKNWPEKQVSYHFAPTDAWERLVAELHHTRKLQQHALTAEELWREIKLDGCYFARRQQALCRKSALRTIQKYTPTVTGEQTQTALLELAYQQGAGSGQAVDFDQLSQWLTSQKITMPAFDKLAKAQTLLTWLQQIDNATESEMLDILKLDQSFAGYHEKILSKQTAPETSLSALGINEDELWQWFFTVRHSKPVPVNPGECWAAFGFESQNEMTNAVLQDYQYHHQS